MKFAITALFWTLCALPSFAECYPPEDPETNWAAELEREYQDEIHAQYLDFFNNAQDYLNCLSQESQDYSGRIKDVLASYKDFSKRFPR